MAAQGRLWRIVGGDGKGGIIVREGEALKSPQLEQRLATGAVVQEVLLSGERLRYSLLRGEGPVEGWISVRIKGGELARPCEPSDDFQPEIKGPSYRCRWAVNIDDWRPEGDHEGAEFRFLLSLIPEEADRAQVLRFRMLEDRKRALLSRLLVRRAAARALDIPNFDLSIKRTKGRKPFLASPLPPEDCAPNWNVNVSHEGSWVVCASEPLCVVGVDVAELRRLKPNGEPIDFYQVFKEHLTEREWADVRAAGGSLDEQYETFSRYWSAKEAFVKARGDGIAYPLGEAEFRWTAAGSGFTGEVWIRGQKASLWHFIQERLPGDKPHWITVARGPLTDIVDAQGEFTATLRRRDFSTAEWNEALQADSPTFEVVDVTTLVPPARLEEFMDSTRSFG